MNDDLKKFIEDLPGKKSLPELADILITCDGQGKEAKRAALNLLIENAIKICSKEKDAYKDAYDKYHYYVNASDQELAYFGIKRSEALQRAFEADIKIDKLQNE